MKNKANESNFVWNFIREKFLYKEIPKDVGWFFTLGSVCLFLFILQITTGIVLAGYYEPTLDGAYRSIQHIQNGTPWGWLVRGTHFWSANFMLLAVLIHMFRVFFHAGYKNPNEFTWMTGVILILLTWAMGLSGYILVWSDRSYWAATIIASCLDYVPLIGDLLLNLVGGKTAGELAIGRYFSFHILLLPILLTIACTVHIILIQVHGEMGPPAKGTRGTQTFYPHQLVKDAVVVLMVLITIILLAKFIEVPTDKPASILASVKSVPKSEWFILFGYEMLKIFGGKWIIIAIIIIPPGAILSWMLLPFYDHNPERAYLKRPIAISMGIGLILVVLHLTLTAHTSSPFPDRFLAPARKLKLKELAGMALFEKNVCYSCHSVLGTGMKYAPDLWKAGLKHNEEYIKKILEDPDKTLGKGKMVKYYLDKPDLDALVSYVKSLDFVQFKKVEIKSRIFHSAYMIYRIKNINGHSQARLGTEEIAKKLHDNKDKLFPPINGKDITKNEIIKIAKYISSLDQEREK